MFALIPSLDALMQCLLSAFTQPSFQTHCAIFHGWLMCLSRRNGFSVFQTIQADTPVNRKKRHPFDRPARGHHQRQSLGGDGAGHLGQTGHA